MMRTTLKLGPIHPTDLQKKKDNFASKVTLNLGVVKNVFAFLDDRRDYNTPIAIFGP